MNLSILDRAALEAIILDPPRAAPQALICSEAALLDFFPQPAAERQARLRLVLAAAHELVTRVATQAMRGKPVIDKPTALKDFLRLYFVGQERESFAVVYLDTHLRVIETETLFAGTLTQAAVHPREVVRRALHFNAAAVCLSHCHPSGLAEPSRADENLTATLKTALALIEVRVIDHIVVACNGGAAVSMAERGLV